MLRSSPGLARPLVAALFVTLALPCLSSTAAAQDQKPWERSGRKYKVEIGSSPQNAMIYIDSKEHGPLGYTPFTVKMPRGSYKVILELPGYRTFERQITVGKRNNPFIFVLQRLPQPAVLDVRASPQNPTAQGADVNVDNVAVGKVPTSVKLAAGRHMVVVNRQGYKPYREWVDVTAGERRTMVVVLVAAAPETGTLLITADVPNAEVYVDNKKQDNAPCVVNLPAGVHMVEVRVGTLQPFRRAVTVVAGKQIKVVADLAAQVPKTGSLRVYIPGVQEAQVLIDGEVKRTGSGEVPNLPEGTHALEVRAEGYQLFEQQITIKIGESTFVKATLEKIPEAKPVGVLQVKSPVPEAEVFIDGASYGKAPVRREVPPGRYIVVVQKPGYPEYRQEVVVAEGQTVDVLAEMRSVGRLMVMAPKGASVLLDGQLVGRTPMGPQEVPTGDHVLEVRHPDFEDHRQPIRIEGGKAANFDIQLNPRRTGPTPEEAVRLRRSLSSFGARALPPGSVTADLGLGFPYIFEGRMTVGVLRLRPLGLDAGVAFRTYGASNEFLAHTRLSFVELGPLVVGADFAIGGGGGPDGRNTFVMQVGAGATMHFREVATFTARGYFDIYSDRLCTPSDSAPDDRADDRSACRVYDSTPTEFPEQQAAVQDFAEYDLGLSPSEATAWDPREHRLNGTRFLLQGVLELALSEGLGAFIIIEGAPFQSERGAFMDLWNSVMFKNDPLFYARAGLTLKY